jgi:nitrogen regulatory protein P-II 1
MFKIEAIIRPHRLDAVREALEALDLIGITVTDCRGEGRMRTATHSFRGSQYSHHLDQRVMVTVAVTADNLAGAVDAIQQAATTGEVGDGKILVTKLHEVVRIRTNERGESALI